MKYRTAFAMALAALILTACAAEPAAGITPAAESAAPAVTTQEPPAAAVASGKPLYILNSGGTAPQFAITDTAAYLPMKFGATLLATKIDFATAQQQVLCSVDGCSHADAGCPAFMAADDDALSQYYTGGLVAAGDWTAVIVTRLLRTAVYSSWIARCPCALPMVMLCILPPPPAALSGWMIPA